MKVRIEITTDNGADVTVERSRIEHSQISGVEVDLRVLDALMAAIETEARAAFGIERAATQDATTTPATDNPPTEENQA